jgi:hypothetical protein
MEILMNNILIEKDIELNINDPKFTWDMVDEGTITITEDNSSIIYTNL